MTKGLRLATPPRRRAEGDPRAGVVAQGGRPSPPPPPAPAAPAPTAAAAAPSEMFDQVAAGAKVQFNKRVTREVADGYEILAIRTRRRVPELLAEALELLEARYGRG